MPSRSGDVLDPNTISWPPGRDDATEFAADHRRGTPTPPERVKQAPIATQIPSVRTFSQANVGHPTIHTSGNGSSTALPITCTASPPWRPSPIR